MGGGNRKDDLVMSNNNVFAALGSLRKKKKSADKDGKSKSSSSSSKKQELKEETEPQVFWSPAPLTAKSWADVDDEDDDDYYATTAPPQSVWGADSATAQQQPFPTESSPPVEVLSFYSSVFSLSLFNLFHMCILVLHFKLICTIDGHLIRY